MFRRRKELSPEDLEKKLDKEWELDGMLAVPCGAWGGDIPAGGWSDKPIDPETLARVLGYISNIEDET